MKKTLRGDSRGLAAVTIIGVVVLIAAIGGVGYYVFKTQKDKNGSASVNNTLADAAKQLAANCGSEDKDICKFYASWKETKYYTITSETVSDGVKSTSIIKYAAPDKTHLSMTGETPFEAITIGNTTYSKDTSDGKWWKQTFKPEDAEKYKGNLELDFSEPAGETAETAKTTYKLIGKEACGNLECFKYQVIDEGADSTEYIWFDTKDYQLRKTLSESADGSTESTFSYDKVDISEPSPIKEVGENQVVIPGSSEPIAVPDEAEMERMMQEAQEAMSNFQ